MVTKYWPSPSLENRLGFKEQQMFNGISLTRIILLHYVKYIAQTLNNVEHVYKYNDIFYVFEWYAQVMYDGIT